VGGPPKNSRLVVHYPDVGICTVSGRKRGMFRGALLLTVSMLVVVACGKKRGPNKMIIKEEYKVLTYEKLKAYSGDELAMAVMYHIFHKVGDDHSRRDEIIRSLPRAIRIVQTTTEVEGEVFNGGFNQYFWNTGGKMAAEALEAYRLIGAVKHAELLEKAMTIHDQETAKMQKFKDKGTLQAFSESYKETELNKLDLIFDAVAKEEDTRDLRVKYVRGHPEASEK